MTNLKYLCSVKQIMMRAKFAKVLLYEIANEKIDIIKFSNHKAEK